MKFTILFLSFIACTTVIYAQNPRIQSIGDRRIETYFSKKGYDSVQFTIVGKNDTVQKSFFYNNGKMSSTSWKNDSSTQFDILGRRTSKQSKSLFALSNDNNSTTYFSNGRVFRDRRYEKKQLTETTFTEDGKLESQTLIQYFPMSVYFKITDEKGLPLSSNRVDTIELGSEKSYLRFDTLFHANGKPAMISGFNDGTSLGSVFLKEDGALVKTIRPDSLNLTEFKDNVDCNYGLKNHRGDTVVKPKFDRIEWISDYFWVAYLGESAFLFNQNGAPMAPPFAKMSNIKRLYAADNGYEGNMALRNSYNANIVSLVDNQKAYFSFDSGEEHGVMDEKGNLVMPPQFFELAGAYLKDGLLFSFRQSEKFEPVRLGLLTRQGAPIFTDRFKLVVNFGQTDYFSLSTECNLPYVGFNRHQNDYLMKNERLSVFKSILKNNVGMGKGTTEVVLPPKFYNIARIPKTNKYVASVFNCTEDTEKAEFRDGIYDTQTKRWLLDTTNFRIDNDYERDNYTFVVEQLSSKKYGIMDSTGAFIVPFGYDSIGVADVKKGIYWVKNKEQYQILDIKANKSTLHKPKYDFLSLSQFDVNGCQPVEKLCFFIAQKKNKWGLINADDVAVKPFDYDYASTQNQFSSAFLLVKNNQATAFNAESLPNETDDMPHVQNFRETLAKLENYKLLGSPDGVFFVNDSGRVVIPPQYKTLSAQFSSNYTFVEDVNKQKKVIFLDNGQVVDFPFPYSIRIADAKMRVIVVDDSTKHSVGVVSTDGKILVPLENYAVSIGDFDKSVFFVKKDTPFVSNEFMDMSMIDNYGIALDTLNEHDKNWLMYDGFGKLLSNKPFRFPIRFQNGFGIGMKDDAYNLYKTDGIISPLISKNVSGSTKNAVYTEGSSDGYRNIRYNEVLGFYTLFYNQGMSPTLIMTDEDGKIRIGSGRYDGISKFYGSYALVSAKGKIGLVDTLGNEVIAPQNLRTTAIRLVDSLEIMNKQTQKSNLKFTKPYDNNFAASAINCSYLDNTQHPDSLNISVAQRTTLWNLMLEKTLGWQIVTAGDVQIPRIATNATTNFQFNIPNFKQNLQASPKKIVVTDSTIAFAWLSQESLMKEKPSFYNFYLRNGTWEELLTNDVLNIQGEKRWLMNDKLTKKIKALKDANIDCTNGESFVAQVESRWLLTKTGIDFCFDDQKNRGQFVVISFSWAELKEFMKIKIF
jgi:WG containing repeat